METIESFITIHTEYNYRVCNICNEEELYSDNKIGVCSMCADNRVEDKIWSEEQRYSNILRTDENGQRLLTKTKMK